MRVHLEERRRLRPRPGRCSPPWPTGRASRRVALTTVTADGGPHRVGEWLVADTWLAGIGFSDPMEGAPMPTRPTASTSAHLGRVVRGTGTFVVSPAPGGAWFVWAEDVELPLGGGRAAGLAVARGPPARLRCSSGSLRRLARRVESRPHLRGGARPRA